MKKVKLPRLLSPAMEERARLHPSEASITFEENAPHTANLYLPPDEPEIRLHDWIELYTISGSAGIYRVTNPGVDVGHETRVVLRHGICVAADDVVKINEDEITGTLSQLLTRFWAAEGVNRTPQFWRLGSIASTQEIKYQPAGHTLLQALQTVLKKARNYALEYDQSVFPWVLNVVERTDANPCEGRFGRNLEGVNISVDDSDQCTRVYLDDKDGYTDADNIAQWGAISRILNVPENATDDSIAAYVADYLDTHKDPAVTIECTGADLSAITGESIDRLTLGRMCRACLPEYNTTVTERIVRVEVPEVYGDPHGVRISMGNKAETMSDLLVTVERDTADLQSAAVKSARRAGGMQKEIDQTYKELRATAQEVIKHDERITEVANTVAVELDAVNAELRLKATQASMDDVRQRMSYAGITLDGSAASVKLLAYQETVEGVNSRLSEAFIEINGAKSEILLKADIVTVDAMTTRLNNVLAGSVKATLLRTANITADGANIDSMSYDGSYITKASATFVDSVSLSIDKSYAVEAKNGETVYIYHYKLSRGTETIDYLAC